MPVSNDFVDLLLEQLSGWRHVTTRKMFGGTSLFCEGKMITIIADDVAYFKVDDTNQEKYEAAGSSPFQPWDDKPMSMSYWELPLEVLENSDELALWAEESLVIQKSAKPKKKIKKKEK